MSGLENFGHIHVTNTCNVKSYIFNLLHTKKKGEVILLFTLLIEDFKIDTLIKPPSQPNTT